MQKRQRSKRRRLAPLVLFIPLALMLGGYGIIARRMQPKPAPRTGVSLAPVHRRPTMAELEQPMHAVLDPLITTHPSPQIRVDLAALINRQKVFINIGGFFGEGEAEATVTAGDAEGKSAVLSLRPEFWMDEKQDRRLKQAVLFHEYQHIRQLLDRTEPLGRFIPQPGRQMDAEEVRHQYRVEYKAYLAECMFLIEVGWVDVDQMCVAYVRNGGEPGMRRKFAEVMADIDSLQKFRSVIMQLPNADLSTL